MSQQLIWEDAVIPESDWDIRGLELSVFRRNDILFDDGAFKAGVSRDARYGGAGDLCCSDISSSLILQTF